MTETIASLYKDEHGNYIVKIFRQSKVCTYCNWADVVKCLETADIILTCQCGAQSELISINEEFYTLLCSCGLEIERKREVYA